MSSPISERPAQGQALFRSNNFYEGLTAGKKKSRIDFLTPASTQGSKVTKNGISISFDVYVKELSPSGTLSDWRFKTFQQGKSFLKTKVGDREIAVNISSLKDRLGFTDKEIDQMKKKKPAEIQEVCEKRAQAIKQLLDIDVEPKRIKEMAKEGKGKIEEQAGNIRIKPTEEENTPEPKTSVASTSTSTSESVERLSLVDRQTRIKSCLSEFDKTVLGNTPKDFGESVLSNLCGQNNVDDIDSGDIDKEIVQNRGFPKEAAEAIKILLADHPMDDAIEEAQKRLKTALALEKLKHD